jgi:hypothetical protein
MEKKTYLHELILQNYKNYLFIDKTCQILGTIPILSESKMDLENIEKIVIINNIEEKLKTMWETYNYYDKIDDKIEYVNINISEFLEKYDYLKKEYTLRNFDSYIRNIHKNYKCELYEANIILDNLFLGSGFYAHSANKFNNFLEKYEITCLINLSSDCIPEYDKANLLELNNKLEINHYLINERDYDMKIIIEAVDKLHELLSNNKKVFIHCSYGRNRSPAIIFFYLIKYLNYSVEDAILLLSQRRNISMHYKLVKLILENMQDNYPVCKLSSDTFYMNGTSWNWNIFCYDLYKINKILQERKDNTN